MSLLDILTQGKSGDATSDIEGALADIQNVQAPSVAQLTLPQLQQYVNAGLMTPAKATAALQSSNAYNNINVDPSTTEAEMTALNQMQQVAGDSGMTPDMRAQIAAATNAANTNTQGERASIIDQAAQKGVPTSLMTQASAQAAAGQDAQTANLADTQAAGQAEQNALTAMANSGNLAGEINNQEYSQQANKAAAQNAIQQWNAENTTQNNQFNAANQQQANEFNTQTNQAVSNANTQNANARTQYNAQVPETVYNNAMNQAEAEAGVNEQQANTATGQAEQNAAEVAALTGASFSFFGTGPGGKQPSNLTSSTEQAPAPNDASSGGFPTSLIQSPNGDSGMATAARGGMVQGGRKPQITRTPEGGVHVAPPYMADAGGQVPGRAQVQGDSLRNDRVKAMLSPKEIVLPRTVTTAPNAPDRAKAFVQSLLRQPKPVKPVHPDDLHGMLEALSRRREAA